MDRSKYPLKLGSTRVWRTYTGGKLLEQWLGEGEGHDGEYPEEWVASVTAAGYSAGGGPSDGIAGLSTLAEEPSVTLKQLIEGDPQAYLGAEHVENFGSSAGLLTKILDSAERLTIQVHPDNEKARELFSSRFGKTEAWYILQGREIEGEKPYVLLGFKEEVTREAWRRMFDEQNIPEMVGALHRFEVEPGDVFLIEGGTPHAIGPGCLLVEIQEPTDLTLRSEKVSPKGREIPDHLCHLGLGYDKMFDCFRYDAYNKEAVAAKYKLEPKVVRSSEQAVERELIGYHHTKCFRMTQTEVRGEVSLESTATFSVMVVTGGDGQLRCGDQVLSIRKGEQLFLPAGIDQTLMCSSAGEEPLQLIRCYPPL